MLRRADQHQLILTKWDRADLRLIDRICHNPQVYRAVDHVLVNLIGSAVFDLNLDVRMNLEKCLDEWIQLLETHTVGGRNPHRSAAFASYLLQMLLDLAQLRQNARGAPVNRLSGRGQIHLSAAAFDEGEAEPFFRTLSRWLTADWVIELTDAAWVNPLRLITSQKSFKVSISNFILRSSLTAQKRGQSHSALPYCQTSVLLAS